GCSHAISSNNFIIDKGHSISSLERINLQNSIATSLFSNLSLYLIIKSNTVSESADFQLSIFSHGGSNNPNALSNDDKYNEWISLGKRSTPILPKRSGFSSAALLKLLENWPTDVSTNDPSTLDLFHWLLLSVGTLSLVIISIHELSLILFKFLFSVEPTTPPLVLNIFASDSGD